MRSYSYGKRLPQPCGTLVKCNVSNLCHGALISVRAKRFQPFVDRSIHRANCDPGRRTRKLAIAGAYHGADHDCNARSESHRTTRCRSSDDVRAVSACYVFVRTVIWSPQDYEFADAKSDTFSGGLEYHSFRLCLNCAFLRTDTIVVEYKT